MLYLMLLSYVVEFDGVVTCCIWCCCHMLLYLMLLSHVVVFDVVTCCCILLLLSDVVFDVVVICCCIWCCCCGLCCNWGHFLYTGYDVSVVGEMSSDCVIKRPFVSPFHSQHCYWLCMSLTDSGSYCHIDRGHWQGALSQCSLWQLHLRRNWLHLGSLAWKLTGNYLSLASELPLSAKDSHQAAPCLLFPFLASCSCMKGHAHVHYSCSLILYRPLLVLVQTFKMFPGVVNSCGSFPKEVLELWGSGYGERNTTLLGLRWLLRILPCPSRRSQLARIISTEDGI